MKSYSSLWIHLVWTTKNRVPVLHKKFRIELFQYIKTNAGQKDIIVDTVNGIEDHLHCLVRLKPVQSVADIVKQLKGSSSRWINQNNLVEIPFSWQAGYGALSVSPAEVKRIRKYIIHQQKHHRHWKLDQEINRFKQYDD